MNEKQCERCQKTWPESGFIITRHGTLSSICRECNNRRAKELRYEREKKKWNEKDFTKRVIEIFHKHGWMVAHFKAAIMPSGKWATPVQADGKGFPDLVIVKEPFDLPRFNAKIDEARKTVKEYHNSYQFDFASPNMKNVVAAELKVGGGDISKEQIKWLLAFNSVGIPAYVWSPDDLERIDKLARGDQP